MSNLFRPVGKKRLREISGAAIAGRTVLPALASINHNPAFVTGTKKSTSKPCATRELS